MGQLVFGVSQLRARGGGDGARARYPRRGEAAYWRGDLFDKRRKLMAAWAAHCDKIEADAGKVVALARARTPQ